MHLRALFKSFQMHLVSSLCLLWLLRKRPNCAAETAETKYPASHWIITLYEVGVAVLQPPEFLFSAISLACSSLMFSSLKSFPICFNQVCFVVLEFCSLLFISGQHKNWSLNLRKCQHHLSLLYKFGPKLFLDFFVQVLPLTIFSCPLIKFLWNTSLSFSVQLVLPLRFHLELAKGRCQIKPRSALAVAVGNSSREDLPFMSGHIPQHPMPPLLMNWPSAISRKKTGTPPHTRQMKYGTKNAPAAQENTAQSVKSSGDGVGGTLMSRSRSRATQTSEGHFENNQ